MSYTTRVSKSSDSTSLSVEAQASGNGRDYEVTTLVRGLEILDLFTSRQPSLSLLEVAEQCQLNRTTAYRFLNTLRRKRYLEFDANTRRYRLGIRVIQLGFDYLGSLSLVEVAHSHLISLRDEVGESAHLGILDNDKVVYVARVAGPSIVSASINVGVSLPAYLTSMGRVLLAYQPQERLRTILKKVKFAPQTAYSVNNVDELLERLERVREQGYAVTQQEFELGVCAVAAPVQDASNQVIAAINISIPTARFDSTALEERFIPAVLRASASLSQAMGHGGAMAHGGARVHVDRPARGGTVPARAQA